MPPSRLSFGFSAVQFALSVLSPFLSIFVRARTYFGCAHHLVPVSLSLRSKYVLTIRQQPQRAKVCGLKERDRRPIDPPPIVQIKLADPASDRNKYVQQWSTRLLGQQAMKRK